MAVERNYDTRNYRGIPSRNSGDVVVHAGLSVTACGHTIVLERDLATKTARVVVSPHTTLDVDGLATAVESLIDRARRFLGDDWTIATWDGKIEGRASAPVATKVAGYKSQSEHL